MKYAFVILGLIILSMYAVIDYQYDTNLAKDQVIVSRKADIVSLRQSIGFIQNQYIPEPYYPYVFALYPEEYRKSSSFYGDRPDPLKANTGGSEHKFHPAVDITGIPGARVKSISSGIVIDKWYERGWHNGKWYDGNPYFNGYIRIKSESVIPIIFYTGKTVYLKPSGIYDGNIINYGHIFEILLHEGDIVLQGQPIAKINPIADKKSTGPHLHLSIETEEGEFLNPYVYMKSMR